MNLDQGSSASASEINLIQRAQRGETKAIGQLYTNHHEQIYRYIWSKLSDPILAEDLTGEVFTRMVARLHTFQPLGVPFQAWLYRIARNLIVDFIRKESSRNNISLDEIGPLPESDNNPASLIDKKLTLERLQEALEKIDPAQAEILRLRFLVGLPVNDVALRLEKTVAAVKALQHRGLLALRNTLM